MASPFVMVIFGATGDLARNKLMPALFSLFVQKKLPQNFYIIGFARRPFTDNEFRQLFNSNEEFAGHLQYQQGDFNQEEGYQQLINKLKEIDQKEGACVTRLFYLSTPPHNYDVILDSLITTKLSEGCKQDSNKWTRIIIEKPFGKDLETAKALDEKLGRIFEEKQIFRVDHYLGKETVQNMIAFRFANSIFEPLWNKEYIDHVQITWVEDKGIEERGAFFDGVGILRDVAQNHLMQLIATIAMEQPKHFSKEGVRDARAAAIAAIQNIDPSDVSKHVVRGQYEGYKNEKGVLQDSTTETFVAIKLFVNTPRFLSVPFYLRAGKKMPKNTVTISIVFKQTCHILFKEYGCPEEGNILTIRIQPDEGIGIRVIAKVPGSRLSLGTVDMEFSYKEEFGGKGADAYEKLLLDIFAGDQMLFNRSDELQSSWEFITKILKGWNKQLPVYPQRTWGPKEAEDLITKDGRKWLI